jgi:hypothetical protein
MYTYKKNLKGKGDPIFIYISWHEKNTTK